MQEVQVWSLGREGPLEKETATHSSNLAWRIPWMEEPGVLQSVGSWTVRQDLATEQLFYKMYFLNSKTRKSKLLQEGGLLPGPETGLLSNTRKWIVQGDTCWQSRRFYWERAPGWRAVGEGTQESCSAPWLAVLGFTVMGLVSGWSLANHSNSESFLVAHASLSQDGC